MEAYKILMVDDDVDDADILNQSFGENSQMRMEHCSSPLSAMAYLDGLPERDLPDLIVTDHFLPGKTGLEFVKDLKLLTRYRNIDIIVFSILKAEAEIAAYRHLGVIDYIHKPTRYNEYMETAERIKAIVFASPKKEVA